MRHTAEICTPAASPPSSVCFPSPDHPILPAPATSTSGPPTSQLQPQASAAPTQAVITLNVLHQGPAWSHLDRERVRQQHPFPSPISQDLRRAYRYRFDFELHVAPHVMTNNSEMSHAGVAFRDVFPLKPGRQTQRQGGEGLIEIFHEHRQRAPSPCCRYDLLG